MAELNKLEEFYLLKEEPLRSCFLGLKDLLISLEPKLTKAFKYGLPFFCYNGKNICYLWKDKKTDEPYIGWVDGNKIEHPSLEAGDRKRIKILRVNPNEDFPVSTIEEVLSSAIQLHQS